MIGSTEEHSAQGQHRRRASRLGMLVVAAALVLVASFAAVALAASTTVTVDSTMNAKLDEQIAVTSQGRTLYALSGETASHLKCKTKECFKAWPPLTVPSRKTKLKAGSGLTGHLGILRRSNGMLQVTVNGRPVYRFFKDHAKGEVNGQGVESFGGTWSAMAASGETSASSPEKGASTPAAPTPPAEPPYGY